MSQTHEIIKVLKGELKRANMTYADVALELDMSEANVKRLFSTKSFSLERLEKVCLLLEMQLSDLFEQYERSKERITRLTYEQEQGLVNDVGLLLVAVSVRNYLSFDDIVAHYKLTAVDCIKYLVRLDHLRIIDLLPNNRYKLCIDEDFSWLKNGPIEKFFLERIQKPFLNASFNDSMHQRLFLFGLLSESSIQQIHVKIQSLRNEFNQLHRKDRKLALEKRHNIGLLLATRPWELEVFKSVV